MVVGSLATSGRPPAYVFVEPSGGWAGALQENARLDRFGRVQRFRRGGQRRHGGGFTQCIFQTCGGWAGVLTENGRLTRSDGSPVFSVDADVDGNTVVAGLCDDTTQGQEIACVFEGLEDTFEAEPAATRIDCKTAGCKIPITCNLSQNCTNRITLLVRARDVRPSEEARAKAPRMIRIASAVANIPPGATKPVRLKLTKPR